MLIPGNTVRYFILTSELFSSGFFFCFFFLSRRNIFDPAPEIGHKEMIFITLVETIYAAQLHSPYAFVYTCKSSSHQSKEKSLLIHEWKSYFHGLEIFKVLNWLMSQYRKTIVVEFFFKAHSAVVEMILFSK